jgi:hypothetical protein
MDVADMVMIIAAQRMAEWAEQQLQRFHHQLQHLVHNR